MNIGDIYFAVCGLFAILGAFVTVSNPNPIRGAMGLLLMILSVAGLFLALHAQFLAAIQLIVYAGAIVVLFIFVIMLLGPSAQTPRDHRGRFPRAVGGTLFALFFGGAGFLVVRAARWAGLAPVDADFGGIGRFGAELFSKGLAPFELSSALLMIAVVGAVAIARGKQRPKSGGLTQPGGGAQQLTQGPTSAAGAKPERMHP
jgi:NADH-quinone oxidoreductase subunit J